MTIMNSQVTLGHTSLEKPTNRIAVLSHSIHKRRQLILPYAQRLPQLTTHTSGHNLTPAFGRVPRREELSLIDRLLRLGSERLTMKSHALLVYLDGTVGDAMTQCQTVEALHVRSLDAECLAECVVFGERQAEQILKFILVS